MSQYYFSLPRHERVEELVTAIRGREMLLSEPEYNAATVNILTMLAEIRCPSAEYLADLSKSKRLAWIRVMDRTLRDIAAGRFAFPFRFDRINQLEVLCVRTAHIMDQINLEGNDLPIKSDRYLKRALLSAGALICSNGQAQLFERVMHKNLRDPAAKRCSYMVAIRLDVLSENGLDIDSAVESVFGAVSL